MTVTPVRPAEVISSVLVPIVSLRLSAMSLIWLSVTWNGLSSAQRFSSSMPSRTRAETLPRLSMTCHTTNQPTRPMTTKPRTAVSTVAGPRGSPSRLSRLTVGWSRAVMSSAATNARATSRTVLMTFISTHSVPARTSSRQPASAATRTPRGRRPRGRAGRRRRARTRGSGDDVPCRAVRAGDGPRTAAPPGRRRKARRGVRRSPPPPRPARGAPPASAPSGSVRHRTGRATLALST